MTALGRVMDPELRRSIVDLGMVRDLVIENDRVTFTLALTIPGCPLRDQLVEEADAAMKDITCYDINDFLKAMADDTRQGILFLLRAGEMSVSELCERLPIHQPTISYHLAVLRRAGLVTSRREGRWVYYRVNPACVKECSDEILVRFRRTTGSILKQQHEASRRQVPAGNVRARIARTSASRGV